MMKSRLVYFLTLPPVNKITAQLPTVLFPIPIGFCVLDWILMVQVLYFLHTTLQQTLGILEPLWACQRLNPAPRPQKNCFKSLGNSEISLHNTTVKYNCVTLPQWTLKREAARTLLALPG